LLRSADAKIVLVTRQTRLEGLKRKYATASQAKFLMFRSKRQELEQDLIAAPAPARAAMLEAVDAAAAKPFDDLEDEDVGYNKAIGHLTTDLDLRDLGLPLQRVDREFVPNLVFGPNDIVVTVGQDGLVANVAKYALGLPIVAINPDPARIDGVLLPFRREQARDAVMAVLKGKARHRDVTLAQAVLTDGQKLLAFNDLFIGTRSHVSARYRIEVAGRSEPHSSSGVVVSTGAGSTGWLSSMFHMAGGVAAAFGRKPPPEPVKLGWEDPRLAFVVREPFVSKGSKAGIVAGLLSAGQELVIESTMSEHGVIFSDGVESDFLAFNSGATARIRTAPDKAKLVTGY